MLDINRHMKLKILSMLAKSITRRTDVKRMIFPFLLLFALFCLPLAAGAQSELDKAIKIGSGPTMVVEYTDPDCPYCRKGSEFFRTRRDVTRYVFFNPLPMHPLAKEKAQHVLSARDKAKAYEEVMSGKLDGKKPEGITREGIKLLEEHMAAAKGAKVDSTPTFVIYGRIIEGFNRQKLEAALGK